MIHPQKSVPAKYPKTRENTITKAHVLALFWGGGVGEGNLNT